MLDRNKYELRTFTGAEINHRFGALEGELLPIDVLGVVALAAPVCLAQFDEEGRITLHSHQAFIRTFIRQTRNLNIKITNTVEARAEAQLRSYAEVLRCKPFPFVIAYPSIMQKDLQRLAAAYARINNPTES